MRGKDGGMREEEVGRRKGCEREAKGGSMCLYTSVELSFLTLTPLSPPSQAHGAMGLSSDRPLAQFFAWARILRLADGPDEVHTSAIGKMELRGK